MAYPLTAAQAHLGDLVAEARYTKPVMSLTVVFRETALRK
jgi:hypothetical protein